jgi:probable rRNA maturation factor
MPEVEIRPGLPDSLAPLLQRAAELTLQQQSLPAGSELTIVLTDDRQLHELNRQYLGVDAPTDVLSFPAGEIDPDTALPYLGDILISFERARAQAQTSGHPVEAELQLLVVHGVLHLLGHDHAEPDEKQRMWAAQAHVLEQLGVDLTPP